MSNKILITGASSDIGLAICEKVISKEDKAILHCFKNKSKFSALPDNLQNKCKISVADFNESIKLEDFCNKIEDIDILINVAAYTKTDLLVNINNDKIEQMINVNIKSIVQICKKVIPGMLAKRKGCIVNISSIAAQRGNRGQTVYAGTKGFIESFTRSLAAEYGSKGIRVNAVAPGPIETGSLKELLAYGQEEVKNSIVNKKIGQPGDVAAMIAFLCSDEASYINGKIINVDGGFCRGV